MALYQVSAGDRILAADLNQFYNLVKGVTASGESVTLIYNAAGVLIFQPSSNPAAGTQLFQIKNNAGTVRSAFTSDGGALYSARVDYAKGADIASAAALTPGVDGNFFHVTGTTTVTSIATRQAGSIIHLEFDGAVLLTYNATTLILQGAVNYTTAAGDMLSFISEGSGNWRELSRRTAAAVGIAAGPISNALTANVNIAAANTFYTGPITSAPGTGTWWASGQVTIQSNQGGAGLQFTAKLWDGTTVIAECEDVHTHTATVGDVLVLPLSGYIVNPAAGIRISVASNGGGAAANILATVPNNGTANFASKVSAYRIV